ncbi:MAG: hypothetical protein JO172_08735, partial [Hyphomicrobiales bacterium]|nr:hypothetical protein [Hyphomicrobiales bacterium]
MSGPKRKTWTIAIARSFAYSLLHLASAAVLLLMTLPRDAAASDDLVASCAKLGNDDALRDYQPSLRGGTVKAFRAMFPSAKAPPDDATLQAQAKFRCMNGKIHVCFV